MACYADAQAVVATDERPWHWALGISVVFGVAAFMINQALRTQVRSQTAELEAKNIELQMEIGDRQRAEEAVRSSELRLRNQNATLSQLANIQAFTKEERSEALRTLTELAARTINVQRSSIWLFDVEQTGIRCVNLYERYNDLHSSDMVLTEESYPAYFRSLKEEHTIAAHDAATDPRTREFKNSYLDVLGITSMLDAPIRVAGRMIGVFCNEHIGPPRQWLIDEQNFAGALADFTALILESGEKATAQEELGRSEEYFRSIINNGMDAVVTMDIDGEIIGWNPQAEQTFGWSTSEAIGRDLGQLIVPPGYRDAHAHGVKRYAETGEMHMFNRVREMHAVDRHGREFPIELTLTSTTVHGSRIVTAFMRDISERKRAEQERDRLRAIEQELSVASRIQQSILPTEFPAFPGAVNVDIHATMVPAKEVAGDFYDYYAIDEDRLAFVIGDVSGKGVPAAIFMAACRTLLKAIALGGKSPSACLTRLNALLYADNLADMFVTLAYGILDSNTGEVVYSLAGHPAPYLIEVEGRVSEIEMVGGTILGIFPSIEYVEHQITLQPGECLLLYTDGVTESMDRLGRLYGNARLEAFLAVPRNGRPLRPLIEDLLHELEQHAADASRHDDITLLALRYQPKQ